MVYVNSLASCIAACAANSTCVDVSLSGAACYMKKSVGNAVYNTDVYGARLISEEWKGSWEGNDTVGTSGSNGTNATTVDIYELIQLHVDAHLVQILSAD